MSFLEFLYVGRLLVIGGLARGLWLELTQWSMLEGESYDVLDSFNGHGKRISRETFANHDLDSP